MQKLLLNTRRPDITICRSGLIRITAHLARTLGIVPGDSINIAFANGECLLFAVHHLVGRHEGRCRPSKKGSGNYCANSARLCRMLLGALDLPCDKVSFMAGEKIEHNDTVYIPLITAAPIFV